MIFAALLAVRLGFAELDGEPYYAEMAALDRSLVGEPSDDESYPSVWYKAIPGYGMASFWTEFGFVQLQDVVSMLARP